MDQANVWIDQFVEDYNSRFSKPPSIPVNAHRPLLDYEHLDDVFTWQEQRTLSASLTLQYDKVLYLIDPTPENERLAGKRVMVIDYPDGRIKIRYEGRNLEYREFDKLTQTHQGEVVSHKRLGEMLNLLGQQQRLLPQEKRQSQVPYSALPCPSTANLVTPPPE
jgi:hypothetical protein